MFRPGKIVVFAKREREEFGIGHLICGKYRITYRKIN